MGGARGSRGGAVALTLARERGGAAGGARAYQRRLHVTERLLERLALEAELAAHRGCVNCLEWSADGRTLASASDDLRVVLWDPFRHRVRRDILTGHSGNIFSVKFLTPDVLATCAADFTVRVQPLGEAGGPYEASQCSCHRNRVKRLATAPDCPDLLWSAGEDGLVLQRDVRAPHLCSADPSVVLVNLLDRAGRYAEAKCLAINPRRPEQLAVGANDFYVRLYDRRMIKPSRPGDEPATTERDGRRARPEPDGGPPRGCVQYFAPGHLSTRDGDAALRKKATTYLAFGADGDELLVNLGSEQVYLFDVDSGRRATLLESFIIRHNHSYEKAVANPTNGFGRAGDGEPAKPAAVDDGFAIADAARERVLPDGVGELEEKANEEVRRRDYSAAVHLYNLAIAACADCAILYSNRAAALMRRNWAGDVYAAVRDCYAAIRFDPRHVKSHFRLAKALIALDKAKEANECLVYFKDKFPKQANVHAVRLLQKDVDVAMKKLESSAYMEEETDYDLEPVSQTERQLRASSNDYSHRYLGHCNTTTDIKEANFLGQDGNFIAAGSDDGSFFIWSRESGNIIRCMRGDDSIVNCIQVHPSMCLIATSGIESVVRLWSPGAEDGTVDPRQIVDIPDAAIANQQRMQADPFEAMLLNITYQSGVGARGAREGGPGARSSSPDRDAALACRTS